MTWLMLPFWAVLGVVFAWFVVILAKQFVELIKAGYEQWRT